MEASENVVPLGRRTKRKYNTGASPVFDRLLVHCLARKAAEATMIPVDEIIGRSTLPDACHARAAVMAVAKERGRSYSQIGRVLDRRDHSTVLSGVRFADRLCAEDEDFRKLMRILREEADR